VVIDSYILAAPICWLCEAIPLKLDARDSTASVSAMSCRMIAPTDRISLMPPAVWPAQSIHSC
jgi:hypothetical protein